MKVAIGNNKKLGKKAATVSRPVGKTCPSSCQFLHNGCYAEKTERIYPNTKTFAQQNLVTERNKIRAILINALQKGLIIRVHERGDWFVDGKLDMDYINDWLWACKSVMKSHGELPSMWFYTHIYLKTLLKFTPYMSVYASVHNESDYNEAKSKGFELFAWASEVRKPHHKSKDKTVPKKLNILGQDTQVCPNQINDKIDCQTCRWCVDGKDDIVFLKH
jgi:hypothetical protein